MKNAAVVVVVLCIATVIVCGLALPPPESGITSAFMPSAADIGSMALIKPPVPAIPGIMGIGAIPGLAGGAIPGLAGGAIPGLSGGAIPGLAGGAIPGLAGGAIPGVAGGAIPGMPGSGGATVPVVGAMQLPVIGSLNAMSIPVAPPTMPPAISSLVKKKIAASNSLSPVPAKTTT